MAARPWHLLSLCDGYGGTELALRSVARVRTVCRVERDAYAAAVLVERMGQARLDQAPVWDQLETFDGAAWRGRVDIVAAGFPCPDFSSAGRRAGVDGEHWLWPEVERITRDVGPRIVLLENVPGLVRLGGLTRVLSDLAALGFDAEWGLLSAADVGATHERERWWCVARNVVDAGRDVDDGARPEGPAAVRSGRHDVEADADRAVTSVADTEDDRRQVGIAGRREQERSWPPYRDDRDGWERWVAAGGPEPVLRRVSDGPPDGLADALHLGGNGLVPQCAAHAWGQLMARAGVIQGWPLRSL